MRRGPIGTVASNIIDMSNVRESATDPAKADDVPLATDQVVCCGGATSWIARPDADALAARLGAVADPIRLQMVSIIANAHTSPSGALAASLVAARERAGMLILVLVLLVVIFLLR